MFDENESKSQYEVIYCDDDPWGTHTCNFVFTGTWDELQQCIEELKEVGCYHIDANYIGE